MASTAQPAKQWSKILPSSSLIERDWFLSGCAGQSPIQLLPFLRTRLTRNSISSSFISRSSDGPICKQAKVFVCNSHVVQRTRAASEAVLSKIHKVIRSALNRHLKSLVGNHCVPSRAGTVFSAIIFSRESRGMRTALAPTRTFGSFRRSNHARIVLGLTFRSSAACSTRSSTIVLTSNRLAGHAISVASIDCRWRPYTRGGCPR